MTRETEIKLATDRAIAPVEIARPAEANRIRLLAERTTRHVDTYLDGARFELRRAGVGLRLRDGSGRVVVCCKSGSTVDGHVVDRTEVERPWRERGLRRARDLPDAVRDRVEPYVFRARLDPIARLSTERVAIDARSEQGGRATICIDRVDVDDGRSSTRCGGFDEIEIEIQDGAREPWVALARTLEVALPARASTGDKLSRALSIVAVELPECAALRLGVTLDAHRASRRILRREFVRMQRAEVGLRTTASADAMREFRAASRRLRDAIDLLDGFVPAALVDCAGVLRTTMRAFSAAAALDSLLPQLEADLERLPSRLQRAGECLLAWLVERCRHAHLAARVALYRKSRQRALTVLDEAIDAAPEIEAAEPLGELAPRLVSARAHAVFCAGRESSGGRRRLRNELRQLRTTIEWFREPYGPDLGRFADRTAHLAELLTARHEARRAVRTILGLRREIRDDGRDACLAAGAWAALREQRARELDMRFQSLWSEFDADDVRTYLAACWRRPVR